MLNRLGEILKQQGRTQTWLANQLGNSKAYINNICRNANKLPIELAYRIKDILELESIEELYKEEQ